MGCLFPLLKPNDLSVRRRLKKSRLKKKLRPTMILKQLSEIAVCTARKERLDKVDNNVVGQRFIDGNEGRIAGFGSFDFDKVFLP